MIISTTLITLLVMKGSVCCNVRNKSLNCRLDRNPTSDG